VTNVEKLYETLRGIQEQKGYFFNKDRKLVLQLLEDSSPTRNATATCAVHAGWGPGGVKRTRHHLSVRLSEPDVKEYGTCYCSLYVSKAWNEGKIPPVYVPNADRWRSYWRALFDLNQAISLSY